MTRKSNREFCSCNREFCSGDSGEDESVSPLLYPIFQTVWTDF